MRKTLLTLLLFVTLSTTAQQRTLDPLLNGLQVTVNDDWLSPPVITLGSREMVNISFDRLTHEYHQLSYHLEHCEADWTISQDLFQVDWLEGFNDQVINDYAASVNTTVPYTHYELQIPNDLTRIKLGGNYQLTIMDDDGGEPVAEVHFMVLEQQATVGLTATTNTDVDVNRTHQQLTIDLNMASFPLTNYEEQLYLVVTQNQQWDAAVVNPRPDRINGNHLEWNHCPALIFDAGNEYHKFEILDVSHTTMGLSSIRWDGRNYQAYPTPVEPSRNYLTDVDADGAFVIRNSDNWEISTTCDYVQVNYELRTPRIPGADIVVSGRWATSTNPSAYLMTYDDTNHCYRASLWQKQGYYNYQFRLRHPDGTTTLSPTEGSYYQTSNRYQTYVYYKSIGGRTWHLVGYRELVFR